MNGVVFGQMRFSIEWFCRLTKAWAIWEKALRSEFHVSDSSVGLKGRSILSIVWGCILDRWNMPHHPMGWYALTAFEMSSLLSSLGAVNMFSQVAVCLQMYAVVCERAELSLIRLCFVYITSSGWCTLSLKFWSADGMRRNKDLSVFSFSIRCVEVLVHTARRTMSSSFRTRIL